MKINLPINETPSIQSYVHHSYINAIVQNEELMEIYIENFDENNWIIENDDIDWGVDKENDIIFLRDSYERDASFFRLKREWSENDELTIAVRKAKILNNLMYVKVFARNDSKEMEDFFLKWNQFDININNDLIKRFNHAYSYYKVKYLHGKMGVYISLDGEEWELLQERLYDREIILINMEVFIGNNQYKEWKNMNYIQLFYADNDANGIYLDYFNFPKKGSDASFSSLCQFLDAEYCYINGIKNYYNNICEYLIFCIDMCYYVNVELDEYFVKERAAFSKYHFNHYNLLNGYDDEKKEFFALGYGKNGKLINTTVSFECVENNLSSFHVVRYKYKLNGETIKFNFTYFKQVINEFVYGENSSLRFAGLLPQQEGIYGLKIFEVLRDKGWKIFLKDRRISFVLYEHCIQMREKLMYLIKKRLIREKLIERLLSECDSMINTSEILKNLVIRYQLLPKDNERILDYFDKLYSLEKLFYSLLIEGFLDEADVVS